MKTNEEQIYDLHGPIAWMAKNRVTANLLMIFLLVGGLITSATIKKEVFPDFETDSVTINVDYPGASPEEVEQGILLVIEENLEAIEGINDIESTAAEGRGTVVAEMLEGSNYQRILQDIKQEIDRIKTFPEDTEEPRVTLRTHKRSVLQIHFYGMVDEHILREIAENARDTLLQNPQISQVDIEDAKNMEIQVSVSQAMLGKYGLSLNSVAQKIATAVSEIPGGEIETSGGEILLRIRDRKERAEEFATIPIITGPGGTEVRLGTIAHVKKGFEDTNSQTQCNGSPAIGLEVFRIGKQTPIGVATAVRESMESLAKTLPPGIRYTINRDASRIYKQRLQLLLKNACIGLILVFILLGLFLEWSLAFWVTMGIPISFLGAMLFLPFFDVSINMISMFAFIIALGIVVDDAIIAGENIYTHRQKGMGVLQAAIQGTKDVAHPITFAILTNIVSFMPLLFIPGFIGKIWKVIPLVVITVFALSWIEALFILPAHLSLEKKRTSTGIHDLITRWQQKFSKRLFLFITMRYGPFLDMLLHWRYLTVALGLAIFLVTMGYIKSGRIGFIMMPRIESDYAVVTAILPLGSPKQARDRVETRLLDALHRVVAAHGKDQLVTSIFSQQKDNEIGITAHLTDTDIRPISTSELSRLWRQTSGAIAGLQSLRFEADRGGPGRGKAITIELAHRNIETLHKASKELAQSFRQFPQMKDIDDGQNPGKEQLDFTIRPEGRALGLTATDIGRQIRNSFYGITSLKQQQGNNEVTVTVRLPQQERNSEYAIESLLIQTPGGAYVPLSSVAKIKRGRAPTTISRRNGRRTIIVGADVTPIDEVTKILTRINTEILPELALRYPGLSYGYEGRQAHRQESMNSLFRGLFGALLFIYFLLAIPFKSYGQPLIVMLAIPFGVVGAVLGHIIMGYNLSIMSIMGIVALSGVLVNDALILITQTNKGLARGDTPYQAIRTAGIQRFRPILLTTLTTFGGLAPMIFESSRQARFMIPMALSLGFGIIFATLITLLIIPCFFLIANDINEIVHRRRHGTKDRAQEL